MTLKTTAIQSTKGNASISFQLLDKCGTLLPADANER